jgi:hypothetical protein
MTTFLLAFIVLSVIVAAMAVGVMFGRSPIKGSCGGMQALGMKGDCDICGGDMGRCEENKKEVAASLNKQQVDALSYDASKK